MHSSRFLLLLFFAALSLAPVHAGPGTSGTSSIYTPAPAPGEFGPDHRRYHLKTVAWVIATRDNIELDDHYVTLVGQVTKRLGSEEYWFSDGTGTILLDSAEHALPVGPRVAIGGRIDQAYLGIGPLEIDVRHWDYGR